MSLGQWEICNYLLDLGVEPYVRASFTSRMVSSATSYVVHTTLRPQNPVELTSKQAEIDWVNQGSHLGKSWQRHSQRIRIRAEIVTECQNVMRRLEDDRLKIEVLSGFPGSFDEFCTIRKSAWPDSSFYRSDFTARRMSFAVLMACHRRNVRVVPATLRSVLGLDNGSARNNLDLGVREIWGETILHGLAMKVGRANERGNAGEWHTLTRDIVANAVDTGIQHQYGLSLSSAMGSWSRTPLLTLISESLTAQGPHHSPLSQASTRPTQSAAIISACEKTIFAWLADLYEGGVDLLKYGMNETDYIRNVGRTLEEVKYNYLPCLVSHNRRLPVFFQLRLIGFQYGKLPSDWKFWWTEPSDQFVGDFWFLVESGNEQAVVSVQRSWKFWRPECSDDSVGDSWRVVELEDEKPLMNLPGAWVE